MQAVYKQHALIKTQVTGFLGFKSAKWPLKTAPFRSSLEVLESRTTSAKSVISSMKTDAVQSMNSKTYQACPGAQFKAF